MTETKWTYEQFYYGNACWPSYTTWRKGDGRYQLEVELETVNSLEDAQVMWSYFSHGEELLEPTFVKSTNSSVKGLHAWVEQDEADYLNWREGAWAHPNGGFPYPHESWQRIAIERMSD